MATESNAGIATTQVYEVYIKATPQAIWEAITSPEWTVKYGYQGAVEYELRPGGAYRAHSTLAMQAMGIADVVIDGTVEEIDPPKKLVHTYRFLFSPEMKAEGFTRVTWEIEAAAVASGFCVHRAACTCVKRRPGPLLHGARRSLNRSTLERSVVPADLALCSSLSCQANELSGGYFSCDLRRSSSPLDTPTDRRSRSGRRRERARQRS